MRNSEGSERFGRWLEHRSRAVIFDMDGLMLDTETIYRSALVRAADEFGYVVEDALYSRLVGRPMAACRDILLEEYGSDFPAETIGLRWAEIWRDHLTLNGLDSKQGLHDILDFIDEVPLRKAVATSSDRQITAFTLSRAGLADRFECIVTGDEIERGKPHPDIFLLAADRLGLSPDQCLVLEDSNPGVFAADAAGMPVIMVPDVTRPTPEAARKAYRVVSSLEDVRRLIGA